MTKINTLALICASLVVTLVFTQTPSAQTTPAQTPSAPKAAPAKAPASHAGAAPSKTALPTTEEIDTYLKRSFGYDPSISWQIIEIRDSGVAGIPEVIVSVNKGDPFHFFFVPSAQTAFVGQALPFGPNPYAPARAKLQAAAGPSRGGENPPIRIVEFSDLECPHCKAAQPIIEKLVADFPQVRFTFQQFPLPATMHPWAMKAAQYADCAGQMDKNAFWKYVDAIFDNQGGIALATVDDKLKELATVNGLNAEKIAACAASPETDARVRKSMELGKSLDVNQTPTVFINGRTMLGIATVPYDTVKSLVQFEIDHAGK